MAIGTKKKIITMMILTTIIMVIEIVVGYMTSCMSLIADSFHMLSDLIALIISFICIHFANKSNKNNTKATFGWVRAEILGALINAVFLITLCFTITIEAIKRMIHPEPITHPKVVLILGFVGLASDLLGMFLFHDSDHGHGHSHKAKNKEPVGWYLEDFKNKDGTTYGMPMVADRTLRDIEAVPSGHFDDKYRYVDKNDDHDSQKKEKGSKLAARGVFLHILGDAVGSLIVIISATILLTTTWPFTIYLDPVLSLLSVLVIIYSTYPLVKHSALILLQTVPENIDVLELQNEFVTTIKGVMSVHDFHVWKLSEDQVIVTAHVTADPCYNYVSLSRQINNFFHEKGIEHITIQVEYDPKPFTEHNLNHGPRVVHGRNNYEPGEEKEDSIDNVSTHSLEQRTDPITGRIYSVRIDGSTSDETDHGSYYDD